MSEELHGQRGAADAVTIVFTDIEASSALWERDSTAMRVALELHDEILHDVTEESGGRIFTTAGDGCGVVYASPRAALDGARAAQLALAAASWPETARLHVRMGIHTGVVEQRDQDIFGPTVNRAHRVMDAGHGGQVLLSGSAVAELEPAVPLVDLGGYQLRGMRRPERLWWFPIPEVRSDPFPPLRIRRSGDAPQAPLPGDLQFDGDVEFVGRARPLDEMATAWRSARDGGSPLVVVAGDAGVGKTRLVAEVASRAHDDGGIVLYGRCDPRGGAPLHPFVDALGAYVDGVGEKQVEAILPSAHEALPRLAQDGDIGAAEATDPSPQRAFHSVTDALVALGEASPGVLLVIDDLHWGDASTAALMDRLARVPSHPGVAIVATYRPTDVRPGTTIEETIGELRRRRGSVVIQLGGFTLAEVEDVVSLAAGHDLGELAPVVAELYETTGGNAFFVRELLRHLVASDAASFDGRRWTVEPLEEVGIPQGVRELVHERLGLLPDDTSDLLDRAAVFGQDFDVRHLAPVADRSVPDVLGALEPAVAAGLLAERGEGRYSFSHLLVQRSIYDDVPRAERVERHAQIARAIEAAPGARRHLSELAHHWEEAAVAGHAEEAVRARVDAAAAAVAATGYDAGIASYRRALDLVEQWFDDVAWDLEIRLRLASALNLAGRIDDAAVEFGRAAEKARSVGDPDALARAALGIGGDLPSTPPVDAAAIAFVEEALAAHPGATATRALLLGRLAERRHRLDTASARRALTDEALQIADELGDDGLRASVLLSRVRSLHGPDSMEDMLAISTEVDHIAAQRADDAMAIRSAQVRMNASFVLGQLGPATSAARVTSVLAQRLRQPEYDRLPIMWEVFRASYEGRYDDARALVAELQSILVIGRHSQRESMVGALLMPDLIFHGRADVAYARALDLDVSYLDALLAWFSAESGALDRASEHLRRLVPVAQIEAESNWSWWQAMVGLTTAADLCGDDSLLAEARTAMLPWAEQHATAGQVTYLGSGHHHVGVAERGLGALDAAVERLEEAVIAHETLGAVPFVAWSQIELAIALTTRRRTGDLARAADLEAAAFDTATSLGLELVLRRG